MRDRHAQITKCRWSTRRQLRLLPILGPVFALAPGGLVGKSEVAPG